MMSLAFYNLFRLLFGTLYPAYASFKAVKTKNVKEYVKWMMYWIVLAFFTCIETFADIFVSWIPFYYELKILFVLWLISPATRGASIIYRKLVHPQLSKREEDIDAYISKASDQGYKTVLHLGSKGVTMATELVVQTAMKGQSRLVDQLKKSYSLNDLTDDNQPVVLPDDDNEDDVDNRDLEESYRAEMKLSRGDSVRQRNPKGPDARKATSAASSGEARPRAKGDKHERNVVASQQREVDKDDDYDDDDDFEEVEPQRTSSRLRHKKYVNVDVS